MKLGEWLSRKWFNYVHGRHLVYNTCWEDPRLDRQALQLGPDDRLLVITSAGCNVLDYALLGPRHIHAVDLNPRQNALLELKMAGIRRLDFAAFFQMFGQGRLPQCHAVYEQQLRADLSLAAQRYWDKRIDAFSGQGKRRSFYFHGTAGLFAWLINGYINRVARARSMIERLLEAQTVAEQCAIYQGQLAQVFWNGFIRWAIDRDATLSFLGVPRAQRQQIERTYPGGIVRFIEDRIETVFTQLPLHDNYFWRVYLNGAYSLECCPEYLKAENFAKLKAGLVERISTHTMPVLDFLRQERAPISRFVLLDHMDWLSTFAHPVLQQQWQALVERAAPGARFLWRSGGLSVDYIDPIQIDRHGQRCQVGDVLRYDHALAATLHRRDRVHTYGSFYIAELAAA